METRQDAGSTPAASTLKEKQSMKPESLDRNSYMVIEPLATTGGRSCTGNNLYAASFQALLGIRFNKSLSFSKYSEAETGRGDYSLDGTFPHFFDFNRLDTVEIPQDFISLCSQLNESRDSCERHIIIEPSNLAEVLAIDPDDSHGLDFRISPQEFFQEPIAAKYIRANLDKIFHKELLENKEEGIFIHYRLGDIGNSDAAVRVEHFEKAIVSVPNYENLPKYISSDSPHDDRVSRICNNYGFVLHESSPQETIKFGSRFTNKLLSYGTFSWFIGVLGSQNNIILPNSNDYSRWHGDIFVFDDWHELDTAEQKIFMSWDIRP